MKDRLIGEPTIEPTVEAPALVAVLGVDLAAPATSLTVDGARRLCGVLVSSPQFVLQGLAGSGGPAPTLVVDDDTFARACAGIAAAPPPGWAVTCAGAELTATRTP